MHFSDCLVGFIEVSGFKDAVKEADKDIPALQKLESDLVSLQERFHFKPTDQFIGQLQRTLNQKVLAFADYIVVSIDLDTAQPNDIDEFHLILIGLTLFAQAQIQCLLDGTSLVGGIDQDLWACEENLVISPAMVNAYAAKDLTKLPIIVLTNKLLSQIADKACQLAGNDGVLKLWRQHSEGDNSFYFLDYFSLGLIHWQFYDDSKALHRYGMVSRQEIEDLKDKGWNKCALRWIVDHASNIEQAWQSAEYMKNKQSVLWLQRYHNESIQEWGVDVDRHLLKLS